SLKASELAQLRGERKAAMAVEDHFLRVADHQPLQAPRLRVQAGHGIELLFDLFPLGKGVDAQALVAVDGDHHAASRGRGQFGAMLCRHHNPALVINRDFCCAAEHALKWGFPTSTHCHPPAPIVECDCAYVNGVTGFFCLCHKDLHAFAKVGRVSQKNSFGFRDLGFKARKRRSWPISRVLSWAIIPLGAASPRPSSSLPGRSAGPTLAPHPCGCAPTSLFGLAPGGVCRAVECCHRRGALLPHPFTLASALRHFGGLLSVALSVGSRPPGVTWHLVHWSPDFPPRTERFAAIAWPAPGATLAVAAGMRLPAQRSAADNAFLPFANRTEPHEQPTKNGDRDRRRHRRRPAPARRRAPRGEDRPVGKH